MKHVLSIIVFLTSFIAFSQVIITTPDASVCQGDQGCFSVATSVPPGNSPLVKTIWNILGPDGFVYSGVTAPGTNLCIDLPAIGCYTASAINQYGNGDADGSQAVDIVCVVAGVNANISAAVNSCNVPFGVTYGIGSSTPDAPGMIYSWTFQSGNPATFSGTNPPLISYNTPGDYNVSLVVTNSVTGCTATATRTMNVSNFNTALTLPTSACVGQSVQFFDNSTVGVNAWSWSATPGVGVSGTASFNSASSQDPFVTFSEPGTYTINLSSSNTAVPCNSSATGTITVNALPTTPSFTQVQNAECAPATVTFTNTTPSPGGLTFVWNFGNGSPAFTGTNPGPQVYTGNGSFTPSVTVTNANGCSASFTGTPIVLSSPIANFKVDLKDGCEGLPVQFTNTSTTTPTITSFQWDFGGAGATPPTSSAQNPVVNFACGIYDVKLIITAGTCTDTVKLSEGAIPDGNGYQTSTSGAQNLLLKYGTKSNPDWTLDHKNDCVKMPFILEDVTNIVCPHEESEIIRQWFFNAVPESGPKSHTKIFTDTMQNVSAENQLPGTDVWLEIDFRGCKDTTKRFNQIYVSGPVSKFTLSDILFCDVNQQTTPLNKSVTINDQASIYGHSWNQNLTLENPQILDSTVANLAFDNVKVTYRWGDGTPDFVEDEDVFLEDEPNKGGTVNPANTTLSATTTVNPADSVLSHTFTQYGTFEVWQIIENFNSIDDPISPNLIGCKDSSSVRVVVSWISTDYVFNEAPLAPNFFDDMDSVCINSPFNMLPRPEAPNTAFTFSGPVQTGSGIVNVDHGPVSHNFTSNPGFTGASSTENNPSSNATIFIPGVYPITLTTTNAVGCSTTALGEMTAFALPIADFSLTAEQGCVGDPYDTNPINNSSHPAGSYTLGVDDTGWSSTNGFQWLVNGSPASGSPSGNYYFSPVTSVTQNTIFTLVVQDAFGCISEPFSATAIVNKPTAGLNIANTVCNSDVANGLISFAGNGNIVSYQWIIDGVTLPPSTTASSIPFPPTWIITDPTVTSATHEVGLIVVDTEGCRDTLNNPGKIITVIAPQANFTSVKTGTALAGGGANDFACPPVIVNFTDASISSGAPVSSWSWQLGILGNSNFGEFGVASTTTNEQNPQGIQYLFPGSYDLRLIIEAGGCIDSIFINDFLSIKGPSGNPSIQTVLGTCGQEFNFNLTNSNNVASWSWNLGDGTTVTNTQEGDNNFIHEYQANNTYYPLISLFDEFGCEVKYKDTVSIPDNGTNAFFTISPEDLIKLGTIVTFDESSTSQNGNLIRWIWNFGDGRIDTLTTSQNVSNQYFTGGDITAILTVLDDKGCKDQYSFPFNIDVKFEMPNVLTGFGSDGPNADLNLFADVFNDFEVTFVNRWGNLVHKGKRDPAKPIYLWNGIDQKSQKLCTEGTYYYVLTGILKNNVEVKVHGFVTLIATSR
jgi:PKD repeat protein